MKPMLAGTPETLTTLKYPIMVSPKLDGIRCLIIDGKPLSRKLLGIPNRYIAETIAAAGLPELDGELMVKGTFQDVTSAIMSQDGRPDFEYHVFDTFKDPKVPYAQRYEALAAFVKAAKIPWLKLVPHVTIKSAEELVAYETAQVEQGGFEGVMIRSLTGPYKFGRSTEREGWLLKVKRFTQEEAVIVGTVELQANDNAAGFDNLGHTKRSNHKAGMRGLNSLGALVVRSEEYGEFKIGTGFDAKLRDELWAQRDALVGKIVTFKYNKAGMKDVPRFPVFIGIRDPRDM